MNTSIEVDLKHLRIREQSEEIPLDKNEEKVFIILLKILTPAIWCSMTVASKYVKAWSKYILL